MLSMKLISIRIILARRAVRHIPTVKKKVVSVTSFVRNHEDVPAAEFTIVDLLKRIQMFAYQTNQVDDTTGSNIKAVALLEPKLIAMH